MFLRWAPQTHQTPRCKSRNCPDITIFALLLDHKHSHGSIIGWFRTSKFPYPSILQSFPQCFDLSPAAGWWFRDKPHTTAGLWSTQKPAACHKHSALVSKLSFYQKISQKNVFFHRVMFQLHTQQDFLYIVYILIEKIQNHSGAFLALLSLLKLTFAIACPVILQVLHSQDCCSMLLCSGWR